MTSASSHVVGMIPVEEKEWINPDFCRVSAEQLSQDDFCCLSPSFEGASGDSSPSALILVRGRDLTGASKTYGANHLLESCLTRRGKKPEPWIPICKPWLQT